MRTHNFRNLSRALWQHALVAASRWGFLSGVMGDAGMGLESWGVGHTQAPPLPLRGTDCKSGSHQWTERLHTKETPPRRAN